MTVIIEHISNARTTADPVSAWELFKAADTSGIPYRVGLPTPAQVLAHHTDAPTLAFIEHKRRRWLAFTLHWTIPVVPSANFRPQDIAGNDVTFRSVKSVGVTVHLEPRPIEERRADLSHADVIETVKAWSPEKVARNGGFEACLDMALAQRRAAEVVHPTRPWAMDWARFARDMAEAVKAAQVIGPPKLTRLQRVSIEGACVAIARLIEARAKQSIGSLAYQMRREGRDPSSAKPEKEFLTRIATEAGITRQTLDAHIARHKARMTAEQ